MITIDKIISQLIRNRGKQHETSCEYHFSDIRIVESADVTLVFAAEQAVYFYADGVSYTFNQLAKMPDWQMRLVRQYEKMAIGKS